MNFEVMKYLDGTIALAIKGLLEVHARAD